MRKLFQDKIEVSYFFNNGWTTKSWQESFWVWKKKPNQEIIDTANEGVEKRNYLCVSRIYRNGKKIYN